MTNKNSESEQGYQNRNSVPILTAGIGTRIKASAGRVGGVKALAEMTGISESQLHRIIKGSQAKIEQVAAMAKACNVTLEWLAMGKGPEQEPEKEGDSVGEAAVLYRSSRETTTGINMEVLRGVVAGIRRIEEQEGEELDPAGWAKMAAALYEYFIDQQGEIRTADQVAVHAGRVLKLIRKAG